MSCQEDVLCLKDMLSFCDKASPVNVNWAKSGAVLLDQQRDQAVSTQEWALLEWGRKGLKVFFWPMTVLNERNGRE